MNISHCRACGASVVWKKTAKGTPIQLNVMPVSVAVPLTRDDDSPVVIQPAMQMHATTCTGKPASARTRN